MTRRLLALARDSRSALGITILSGFLAGLLTIYQASSLSHVVNGVFLGGWSWSDSIGLLQLILVIIILRSLLAWVGEVSSNSVAVKVKNDLRRRLFLKIQDLGPAYTRNERTGELVNAAIEGIEGLDAYFSQYLPQLVVAALVPFSIVLVVFPGDPLSGVILLLTAPLIPVFMVLIGRTAETLTTRQWETLSRLSAHFLDSLQGLTTLKELGRSRERADSIAETSDRFRDVTLGILRVTFLSALVLELVATVSTALVAVEVGLRLLYGHMVFQQALFLLLLAPEFYIPLRMLGLRFHAGMAGTSAARRIFEILDLEADTSRVDESTAYPFLSFSVISVSDLSFTYPGGSRPALQSINLEIKAGEHVALVGESGSGKSTLAAILLRFMEPGHGSIRVDGKPFAEIPKTSWRNLTAWLPQKPHLFHDTIVANLLLAKPDATPAEISSAIAAAHLAGFIQSLPMGLETAIGEGGTRLSGGQAQRLALARAFLKNAPILILDEPTSSLDPEYELLVESAIRKLMQGRTVITIAHRLNTVFQADKIFVLDGGRLVESGTHGTLLAQGGVYTRLVGAAAQDENLTTEPDYVEELTHSPIVPFDGLKPAVQKAGIPRQPPTVLRLLRFLGGSWGWVTLSILLGVLTVGSNVGLMGTSAYLLSTAALHPELGTLQVAIVGVRFFGIARGVFRYAERLTSHNTTFRLLSRLRTWFYKALEPLAPARLMQVRSGDLLARIVTDVESLENFYVRVVAPPLVAVVVAAGMTIFLDQYDVQLGRVYLLFMLVLGAGVPFLSWILSRRAGAELVKQRAGLQSRLVDDIQGLADITVFDRGSDYLAQMIQDGEACGKTQRKLASVSGLSSALSTALVNLGMLSILAMAILTVGEGRLPGVMLAVLALAAMAGFEAVMPLPLAAQTLSSSLQSARRLFELVDTEPAVKDRVVFRGGKIRNTTLQISGLDFSYPGNSDLVLKGIDFTLPPGKRLAIVGPSGAGKSTLVNLLMRFWDYSQGCILLDGRDLHEYPQEQTRQLFSVLSQRTYFFNDTIRQNLLLARPTASEADLQMATKQAQIHDFIMGLPGRYETNICEQGLRLSGGEMQRLAIARALLKHAPLFLLDEPTANLDPVTEQLLLNSLFTLTQGQSLVHITHRLVGLEQMDEILVLDHGRITERGTQDTLLAAGGIYRHLWNLQNLFLSGNTGA
jgi:ATP-binding cassette subfamily C protein CydCD